MVNKQGLLDESLRCYNMCKRFAAENNFPEFQYWKGKLTGIGASFIYFGYAEEGRICQIRAEEFVHTSQFPMIKKS